MVFDTGDWTEERGMNVVNQKKWPLELIRSMVYSGSDFLIQNEKEGIEWPRES